MATVLALTAPRSLEFVDQPDPPLGPTQVRVRTLYSGISAGTELTQYRGTNPWLHKRWDPAARLFLPQAEEAAPPWPLTTWGYEEVGTVTEVGSAVTRLAVGDVLYGTWGHRSAAVLEEDFAAVRVKPPGLEPLQAIFSHLGPIALTGILDAQLHIGETVAIFGLGAVGQVVAQLAKGSGAAVIGVDLMRSRLDLATRLGAIDDAISPSEGPVAERVKELTGGRGADVCIECSGSSVALHEATRAAAYNGRVVAMGFIQGGAGALYLGEEFHHNRIQIVSSQIGQVAPELSRRWDRLRLIHTIMGLQVQGMLKLRPLITHRFPFAQAADAFALLDGGDPLALVVVLTFGEGDTTAHDGEG